MRNWLVSGTLEPTVRDWGPTGQPPGGWWTTSTGVSGAGLGTYWAAPRRLVVNQYKGEEGGTGALLGSPQVAGGQPVQG